MLVVVGRIGRAHGIRGDVLVSVRTDEPELRFAAGQQLFGGERMLTVASSRWHSGKLVVRFAEIVDRTAAEAAGGTLLETQVDPADVPDDEDAYYDHQLIGLEVICAGETVGTVRGVEHPGSQDLLRIEKPGGQVLVPFVAALVPEVDLTAGRVIVADRPGLLDPEQAEAATGQSQQEGDG